ncbi:hypothetical protein TI39_contig324g00002 [Zymoseptoria brevis]|uniref:Uncharacterized protein n=1 Tax=Zymoseptoria brevis TaxID=1047168 RepID=A0A0F4GSY9_9PEZI|nr:hypothetical protein TI39_contig324g00002 [Zymoseptoria brevis]
MAKNLASNPSSTSHDDQHEPSSSGARTSKSDHEHPILSSMDAPSENTFQVRRLVNLHGSRVDRVVKKKDKQGLRTVTWKHTFEPVEALMRPDVGSAVKAELRELLRDRDSKDKGEQL